MILELENCVLLSALVGNIISCASQPYQETHNYK